MELIMLGGNILTMDGKRSRAQALAINNNKITAIGNNNEIATMANDKTKVVHLRGRTVTPGFIDPHNHFSMTVFEPVSVDSRTPPLKDKKAVLDAISTTASATPKGKWIWGQSYDTRVLKEAEPLTCWELDEAAPDNPVCIMDASYHALYANTAAMAIAGITKNSPDPYKGTIVKNRKGEPTGYLHERAMDSIHQITMRSLIDFHGEEIVGDLVRQNALMHLSHGVTSIGDAQTMPESAELYRLADSQGKLPICVRQLRGGETFFGIPDKVAAGEYDNDNVSDRLRGGTMKIFMDPVFPEFGFFKCHHDGSVSPEGEIYYEQDEVDKLVLDATNNGLQVAIHCIGNRSIEQAVNSFERALNEVPDADKLRLRLDHFMFPTQELIQRAADLPIVISHQSAFLYNIGDVFEQGVKDYGINAPAQPMADMVSAGATIAAGSDFPCASVAPIDGIAAAASRRHVSGRQIEPGQAISAEEAISHYTNGSSFAIFRDHEVGSIEVGKRADMVVLSHDPTESHVDHIKDISVEQTYVDGKLVYSKGAGK